MRSFEASHFPGRLGLPGGIWKDKGVHISPRELAKQELLEETGIDINAEHLKFVSFNKESKTKAHKYTIYIPHIKYKKAEDDNESAEIDEWEYHHNINLNKYEIVRAMMVIF